MPTKEWYKKNREYLRGYNKAKYDSEARKLIYATKRANGECGVSGCSNKSKQSMCEKCMAKNLLRMAKRRAKHKKIGKCLYCVRNRLPGETMCQKHKDEHKVSKRKLWDTRIAKGKCWRCGGTPQPGNKLCERCHKVFNKWRKERKK